MKTKKNHPRRAKSGREDIEISLRLGTYDDIFSVFDMRPYGQRALSVDFIDEVKRASMEKSDRGIDLSFYLPKSQRHLSKERTIQNRLVSHFRRHYHLLVNERKRVLHRGIAMVAMGVVCMIAATIVLATDPSHSLSLSFLVVFLEPAAWFLLWEGMDQIIFNSQDFRSERHFYKKMIHADGRIHFRSYPD